MGWTHERERILKKLWLEGLSASQIEKQLGGVSRNAVIGKIHRMGLAGRATPSAPRPLAARRPARPPTSRPPKAAKPAVARSKESCALALIDEDPGTATIHTLESSMCKWPIGDPAADDFTFCGKRTANRKVSFCLDHAHVAYQPRAETKRSSGNELARSLRQYL
ncbi:MAG TPA: GcrA family cell cycle regulator [Candidatus Paceibacterota bacterium]|nr:GcrA family cell cycle regulator [Candidatus Paceibacterota bacterium]